ncbi:hypothetical protein ECC02_009595 [Trypanosoma cruzi]|uniref:Uncharacterized protein n=1 Tax=Trypanosoma cruzi TaxID=5693 RepID=A0A7J6XUL6_TRYCR|nr:hypothetical protein ECC02_009595 [Trypanosoma cruzi]
MSPWLSAGTHSPHAPLQPTAVHASADTASSSGAHTHAELLRLPSISRRRDGARVVVVVGTSVVVVLGASGAVVVVVVLLVVVFVVGAFVVVVVVVVVVFGFISISALLSTCPAMTESDERNEPGSSSETSSVVSAGAVGPGLVGVLDDTAVTVLLFTFSLGVIFVSVLVFPTVSVTHTEGQQHRASTSRAHSRRHVIIVSVSFSGVELICTVRDMESNRGDERCGRHTQRAHHMRRGQQPGMHRTPHTTHDTHSNPRQQAHTHTQPCRNTNTQMEEEKQTGAAHKAPPHVHTARAVRRVGTPHGGYAHKQEEVQRTQQHKSKVTIIKRRDPLTPRGMLVHGMCSQYSSQK